ncbi:MAG: ABC transporter permease [Firmicutes bacterium]|nr:ABC transporter permease [Bacillota bacterium]
MHNYFQAFLSLNRYAWRVFARNMAVFKKTYKANIAFNFFEPLLYLAAMGMGLGAFVGSINGISYVQFIAPGMIASSAMWAASSECTYDSFVRMKMEKIYHAIVVTPINLHEVIAGELFTGTLKSVLYGSVILLVITGLGLVTSFYALLVPFVLLLCGIIFSELGMIWTGLVAKIDSFSYFFTLIITPMYLFSGVFFPIEALPDIVQTVAWFLPLYHVVTVLRSLVLGLISPALFGHILWLLCFAILIFPLPLLLIHKRFIK